MTISEIAAKAGASAATVSRVLNGNPHVKESTRERILNVIQQNDYIPSEIARGLSKNESNSISVFVTDIENSFFSRAMRGIVERADLYGYNVFLFNTNEDIEKEHRYLQTVMGLRIMGLIITPVEETDDETRIRLQRIQASGVPVVLLDRDINGLQLDGVFSEDEEGAYKAVMALVEAGHRKIAIISGPKHTRPSKERMAGYQRAMRDAGLPVRPEYVSRGDFRTDLSYVCTKELMGLPDPPTAIFSTNNLTTIGCLKYFSEAGLVVGRDISLVSFDDLDYLDYFDFSISAVRRSFDGMGRQAMNLLQQRMRENRGDGAAASLQRIYEKTQLELRGYERLPALEKANVRP